METLAESLDSANNAVFLAMHTISALMSQVPLKNLYTSDGLTKEVKSSEVLQLLSESNREVNIGFGAGYDIKSVIRQAVSQFPFSGDESKGLGGVVLLTLTSSLDIGESDFLSAIFTFRQFSGCTGNIVFSGIREPNLEPNLIVAAFLIVGCKGEKGSQKKSLFSRVAPHLPFLFSIFGRETSEREGTEFACSHSEPSCDAVPVDGQSMSLQFVNSTYEAKDEDSESEQYNRKSSHNTKGADGDIGEVSSGSVAENTADISRERDTNFSTGPGIKIAQQWSNERTAFVGSNQIDVVETFTTPVGVKSSINSDHVPHSVSNIPEASDDMRPEFPQKSSSSPSSVFPDRGLEVMTEIYNTALTLLKGTDVNEPRKRGLLSERAASMLESERESPKSLTPLMEMLYRGGIYKGRCEGGLPEGKGCLTFPDGSFYDGMWHYGKRSGLGTFFYSNGDVFQGSWRDDLMHGKGWFYFHTGDRWFANFWKGKANGEGRFYADNGSIFFGSFQNGWRHGECLFIDVDGSRWTEIWKEGIFVRRLLLEKGSER